MTTTEKELERKPPTILEEPAQPAPVLEDDGLGPTNEDEDEAGLPADSSIIEGVDDGTTTGDLPGQKANGLAESACA